LQRFWATRIEENILSDSFQCIRPPRRKVRL
jgi:hypothetical protein